jgi:hypothetical protein
VLAYKDKISPELNRLPSPTSEGNEQAFGFLLFLFLTLFLVITIKRASHDLLNKAYDRWYRDRRRSREDNNYSRAVSAGLLPNDKLANAYEFAKDQAKKANDPVTLKVDLLEWQNKLARTMSFVLALAAVLMVCVAILAGYTITNFALAGLAVVMATYMWVTFCRFRWEAGEALILRSSCKGRLSAEPKREYLYCAVWYIT